MQLQENQNRDSHKQIGCTFVKSTRKIQVYIKHKFKRRVLLQKGTLPDILKIANSPCVGNVYLHADMQ